MPPVLHSALASLLQTAAPAADSLARTVAGAIEQVSPALRARVQNAVPAAGGDSLAEAKAILAGRAAGGSVWGRAVDGFNGVTGLGRVVAEDLLVTVIVVGLLWGVRWLVLSVVRRRSPEPRLLYQWRKGTTYAAVVVGILLLFRVWIGALGSFGTFLGLLTAGVAIALRDPLVNLAAWFFILWKRPFTPGDRVTVRMHTGDVIDQRVFQFTLLEVGTATGAGQSTGRIIHVPNGWVFSDSVVNHTGAFAYVWNEISVTLTFESAWREAKDLLTQIAHTCADPLSADAERTLRQAAREYFIFYSKLTPVVYTSVDPEGVRLTLRYLVAPRRVRGSEEAVWEAILDAFAARDDIDLAYPTTRIFRTPEEGKPQAGGQTRPEGIPHPSGDPATAGRVYD